MGSLHLVGFDHTPSPKEEFSPSGGIFKVVRVSPHISTQLVGSNEMKTSSPGGGGVCVKYELGLGWDQTVV